MTLPKTPLKEWLSSSSSPQSMDQRGGSCRILLSSPFSPRKCPPKSPPSSDPEDGEMWLQEARALLSSKCPTNPHKIPFRVVMRPGMQVAYGS